MIPSLRLFGFVRPKFGSSTVFVPPLRSLLGFYTATALDGHLGKPLTSNVFQLLRLIGPRIDSARLDLWH